MIEVIQKWFENLIKLVFCHYSEHPNKQNDRHQIHCKAISPVKNTILLKELLNLPNEPKKGDLKINSFPVFKTKFEP